jgi:ABC-2 type transport system ATP-binding protein
VGKPDDLTRRLQGFETVLVTAEGPGNEIKERMERVTGVDLVEQKEGANGQVTFEIHAHKDQDVRSELARAIVESQWKLLELRASALSLEDIFLKLTTKDLTEEAKN